MDPGAAPAGSPRATGVARNLGVLRQELLRVADELLQALPDVGEHTAQRALDAFVEQASDTARAHADAVEDALVTHGPAWGTQPAAGPRRPAAPARHTPLEPWLR
ncbi:MAG TPA: hypothetical protein VHM65_03415 [Candidatus Lustribacter sp.]|nr:hypothetical protein [Candidatus Lustribacter sp.]